MKNLKRLTALSFMLAASLATAQAPLPTPRTTRDNTLVRVMRADNPPLIAPYRFDVQYGDPEPGNHVLELVTADSVNYPKGVKRASVNGHFVGTPLLAFAHLTDPQIVDDASPARVAVMDYTADGDVYRPGLYTGWDTGSAYRPQEFLSTQILDAMVRAIRNVGTGPLTGLPLSFTITTGDMADNAQKNEVQWSIQVMDGGSVTPKSGRTFDDSPSYSGNFRFWHPSVPADAPVIDDYQDHGFPSVKDLLLRSRQTFPATGLGMPWYGNLGNHDVKVQGNAPIDIADSGIAAFGEWLLDLNWGSLNDIATGGHYFLEIEGIPRHAPDSLLGGAWYALTGDHTIYSTDTGSGDANRKLLDRAGLVREHWNTTGLPAGHGFTQGSDKGYYAIPSGPNDLFQFISLDSNASGLGNGGDIDSAQLDWLEAQLKACSSRYRAKSYNGQGAWVNQSGVKDKMVVVYCHHPIRGLPNAGTHAEFDHWGPDPANPAHQIAFYRNVPNTWTGTYLEDMLLRFPNVVLVLNGHTHNNTIVGHKSPFGSVTDQNGFFEITTASVIDWPMQSRIIEFSKFQNNLMIHTTMVQPDADLVPSQGEAGLTLRGLATWGLWATANDPQEHKVLKYDPTLGDNIWVDGRAGDEDDRNVELMLPMPFALPGTAPSPVPTLAATLRADGHMELVGLDPTPGLVGVNQFPVYSAASFAPNVNDHFDAWTSVSDGQLTSVAAGAFGPNVYGDNQTMFIGTYQPGGDTIWYTRERPYFYAAPGSYDGWHSIDGAMKSVAVTKDVNHEIHLFGIDGNGVSWHRRSTSTTYNLYPAQTTWGIWGSLGSSSNAVITAGTADNGKMQAFVIDVWGNLYTQWETIPGSHNFANSGFITAPALKAISVSKNAEGDLELFAIEKATGHLIHSKPGWLYHGQSSAGYRAWDTISTFEFSQVTSSPNVGGGISVYAVDSHGSVFTWSQTAPYTVGVSNTTYGPMQQVQGRIHP